MFKCDLKNAKMFVKYKWRNFSFYIVLKQKSYILKCIRYSVSFYVHWTIILKTFISVKKKIHEVSGH